MNEELNFLGKFTKKKFGVGREGGSGGGSGWWRGEVRVDVNEEFKCL